jgi:hypothetical protein
MNTVMVKIELPEPAGTFLPKTLSSLESIKFNLELPRVGDRLAPSD